MTGSSPTSGRAQDAARPAVVPTLVQYEQAHPLLDRAPVIMRAAIGLAVAGLVYGIAVLVMGDGATLGWSLVGVGVIGLLLAAWAFRAGLREHEQYLDWLPLAVQLVNPGVLEVGYAVVSREGDLRGKGQVRRADGWHDVELAFLSRNGGPYITAEGKAYLSQQQADALHAALSAEDREELAEGVELNRLLAQRDAAERTLDTDPARYRAALQQLVAYLDHFLAQPLAPDEVQTFTKLRDLYRDDLARTAEAVAGAESPPSPAPVAAADPPAAPVTVAPPVAAAPPAAPAAQWLPDDVLKTGIAINRCRQQLAAAPPGSTEAQEAAEQLRQLEGLQAALYRILARVPALRAELWDGVREVEARLTQPMPDDERARVTAFLQSRRALAEGPDDALWDVLMAVEEGRATAQQPTDDPLGEYEQELRGVQPHLPVGSTQLYSAEYLQEPDGWHLAAYEGLQLGLNTGSQRWRTTRSVMSTAVEHYMHAYRLSTPDQQLRFATLEWVGDSLLVTYPEGLLHTVDQDADGLYEMPPLPLVHWHALPAGERASEVSHMSRESALADAERALRLQAEQDRAREARQVEGPPSPEAPDA